MSDIISSAVDRILELLATAAADEIKSLLSVREDLADLQETFSDVKAVLQEASKRKVEDERLKKWLTRLEDAVVEADDLMDSFSTEMLLQKTTRGNKVTKKVRTFFSSSNQIIFRHHMASKINDLKETLKKIKTREGFMGLSVTGLTPPEKSDNSEYYSWRDTQSLVQDEENVLGRDDDKDAIITLLFQSFENENGLPFIPVVGMGGLGKTTVARLVFNDKRVKQHFEMRIWVCVSKNFDVRVIIGRIIESITCTSFGNSENMELLTQKLNNELSGKRYLLVLDDVWNINNLTENWERLKRLLVCNAGKGSRVIVTTRDFNVAEITRNMAKPYHLGKLNSNDSWSLFIKKALKQGNTPDIPKVIRHNIVEKCGGIPLAIKAIAGILASKDPETEWEPFVDKKLLRVSENEGILKTLQLSYDDLKPQLKKCFAYCSLFPEDYEISVETLINLWIAQGFIDSSSSLEKVGYNYFKELFHRSFFQEVETDEFGNMIHCKIHDLMQQLAEEVAKPKCIKLSSDSTKNDIHQSILHLSFDLTGTSYDFPNLPSLGKRIRTMVSFSQSVYHRSIYSCDEIVSNFRFLHMLDLYGLKIQKVPSSIGELKHLRYLDLSYNRLRKLPDSITSLINLHTLDLTHCNMLEELPRDTNNLVNLSHLKIEGCFKLTHMPSGLGRLTKLQTLSVFVFNKDANLKEKEGAELIALGNLNNLKGHLEIKNLRHCMAELDSANFQEKHDLRSLSLEWDQSLGPHRDGDHERTLGSFCRTPNLKILVLNYYMGFSFPSLTATPSLRNLVRLEMYRCQNLQQLPPLDEFSFLRELRLVGFSSLESIVDEGVPHAKETMPSLERLELTDMFNLKGWWKYPPTVGEDHVLVLPIFPKLMHLSFIGCPQLSCMPLYPYLEGELVLDYDNGGPFLQTLMMHDGAAAAVTTDEASSSASFVVPPPSFRPLSKLTKLFIKEIHRLTSLPNGLRNLTSLKKLQLSYCYNLKSLSPGIQHLTWLETLEVTNCEKLDISNDDDIAWDAFESLSSLVLFGLPLLVDLPQGLQHVTTLQHFSIGNCVGFTSLPDWISSLTSLTKLSTWNCINLSMGRESFALNSLKTLRTSQPEAIGTLTCLQTLLIDSCHHLTLPGEIINALVALRELKISNCKNLESLPATIGSLNSLETLIIDNCPNLELLPEALGSLSSVQYLCIENCPSLESLPKAIGSLTCLQTLVLDNCPKLSSLPKTIHPPIIENCPKLTPPPKALSILGCTGKGCATA